MQTSYYSEVAEDEVLEFEFNLGRLSDDDHETMSADDIEAIALRFQRIGSKNDS